MAGLLDFEDPGFRLGMGLLALGQMPKSQGFQGLMGLMANEGAVKQQEMQRQLMQSQIDENRVQNKQREMQMKAALDKQAWEQTYYMGEDMPNAQGAGFISPSVGSSASAAGQGTANTTSATPSRGKFDEWSRMYGIPKDALITDWKNNGGKGLSEMLAKHGARDMQVTNGYAYDRNSLGAGFMPSLSTSQDGKTSMVRIGPDGLPVVSAPQGSMETYAGYQGAQAAFKPIKVWNPETQREEFSNEGAVVRGRAAPQYSGSGYSNGSSGAAANEQRAIMQAELDKLPANHPDRAAIMREMSRLPAAGGGGGGFAAGPSAAELAANEASKVRATDTAKADVVRDTSKQADGKRAGQLTAGIDRAIELLNQRPTASGVGALVDRGLGAFGASTPGSNTAAQLEALSGWLVSNVPRMEGPQSDRDVQNYRDMAGTVGDRTKPIDVRLAAAQEVRKLQEKYASLNSGERQPQPQQREFSMLPKASEFDGKRMRAPDGTIYRSTGGKWMKE